MSASDDLSGSEIAIEFTPNAGKSQQQIMDELLEVCKKIEQMRADIEASRQVTRLGKVVREAKPSKTRNSFMDGVALQKYKVQRKALMDLLEKPHLVSSHPFPDTLEPFFKRTRNEVREFMGLERVEGGDDEYL